MLSIYKDNTGQRVMVSQHGNIKISKFEMLMMYLELITGSYAKRYSYIIFLRTSCKQKQRTEDSQVNEDATNNRQK